MAWIALILVIVSAAIHAGWNLLSKSRHPSTAFFLAASAVSAVVLSPALLLHAAHLRAIPGRVWVLLVATGFCLATYYAALAGAYRSGDMSVAYPVARSFPVIVVLVVTLLLGRGAQVSGLCIVGTVLVVLGCFLIPMRGFRDFRLANYLNATCGLALLAACSTAGYTIVDDEALRHLRAAQADLGTVRTTAVYACLEATMSFSWLLLFILPRAAGRARLREVLRADKRAAAAAGVAIWLAYGLVLVSLAFVRNVSYVASFRQLSIPLGTVFGVVVLKEPAYAPRLTGVAVVFAGLVLVAVG